MAATCLALLSASDEQHLFHLVIVFLSGADQNFIKTPVTLKPALFKRRAATLESTPPDIAAITFCCFFFFMFYKSRSFGVAFLLEYVETIT